ncbi:Major facilitator superfamily domain, general substrate transporter [Penicillium expansum]|uniref:Major facilitator superfamily domain, general substrate transporter n=1 Tax=Penicillium expansum TaxID=27334 RepID=A0A0A2JTF2_PENEN|nr:Major facilitator superfamily domain, general substrate transporter [Penicillium expansum]KGO47753.1 Major facilitator superfamily domain, general substrate transporter [Penicillium expansum]KGO58654.1 Major facilitator superfamily domain, general substrate transporter [Penicillium expansum]KGO58770.1 Major facilitator superfamily domain, general substrate transporter [Penicillium expansum]
MVVLDKNHQGLPGSNLEDKGLDDSGSSSRAEDYYNDRKQTPPANDNAPLAEPEAPPRDITGWRWYLTLASILASTFLYALDATVVADLQSVIVQDLGGVTKLSWLSVAFLLSATATNLVWGRIYGHFNTKWLYIFHVTLFEVGSAICGAAPSMNVMILGRAIAGVGGSGLYVGCMTLIAMTTTISERPIYISCTGLSWGLGIVLGPVIGGAFSESSVGWRWAFYINLFIGAVCAPFYLFLIPNKDPRPGASIKERSIELDYPGIVLQCGALTALILAINLGGVTYLWNSGRIIAMFVVSGVLFIALGIQQVRTIGVSLSRRIIPVQFFRSKTVLILFAASASGGACAFVPIYMIPLFFQFTRNDGPLDAGVRLLPFVVVMVVFVFTNGNLMARLGYYMPWYLLGGLLIVLGSALMYTVDQETSQSRVYGYTVPLGVGVGMFMQASFSVAQAVVSPENIAPAIGFITLAQFVGITMALAIANAVLLNGCLDKIEAILPNVPSADIQAAILGAQSDLVKNLSPELKTRLLDAIVKAIGNTYILTIAGGALVAVLSLLLRREKLFGVPSGVHAA